MSYYIVMSFGVENPRQRLETVLRDCTLEETIGVVTTEPNENERGRIRHHLRDGSVEAAKAWEETIQYEVLALRSSQWYPDVDAAPFVKTDDETLFGPFAALVLEPGEYACVLGLEDTVMAGQGHIYYNDGGEIRIVEELEDDNYGKDSAYRCMEAYGFRPFRGDTAAIQNHADYGDDPMPLYTDIERLEQSLTDESVTVTEGDRPCPHCGSSDVDVSSHVSGPYCKWASCNACGDSYDFYERADLPLPDENCPDCGGRFRERTLQFPSLGSTAYECENCGTVTFDTLTLDGSELCPDADLGDRVGPDIDAYCEKHGLDPEDFVE